MQQRTTFSAEMDAAVEPGRCPSRVGTAPDERALVFRHFEMLSSPRLSAERISVASDLCAYLDELRIESNTASPAPVDRRAIARRAARQAFCMLASDATGGDGLHGVRMFLAACQQLMARVLDVRNFDKPAAHALFSLVEGSVLTDALRDVEMAWPGAGPPRDREMSRLSSFSKRATAELPALLASSIPLALSEFPATRLPHILGFGQILAYVLAVCSRGTPRHHRYRRAWHALRLLDAPSDAAAGTDEGQVRRASMRGARIFGYCVDLLASVCADMPHSNHARAVRIFEEKARYAMLHHKEEVLGGRRLVEWFSDKPFRAAEMLRALYESPWIDKRDLGSSQFFKFLTCRGGKMDGVFSPAELEILKKHLASSPHPAPMDGDDEPARYAAFVRTRARALAAQSPAISPRDHRTTFFHLVDFERRPSAVRAAGDVLAQTLREAESLRRVARAPALFDAFQYEKSAVEDRVSRIYWHQAEHVQRMRFDFDEVELRRFHLYFAPFALIDGCWLRHTVADKSRDDVRLALYGIYSDEVGNGHLEYNHARLYGQLLRALDCDIPTIDRLSPDLASEIPVLAFKAPAFLLALNLAHADYFPELLGVTLAVELSGLDGLYEKMIAALESKGHPASFWRLHVSVDNFSTGHARQSLDACIDFIEDARQTHGHELAQAAWDRIWSGLLTMLYLFDVELRTLMGARAAGA